MKTLVPKLICLTGVFLAASLVPLNAATFFGPTPYRSSADVPAGLYLSGAPTFLENFENGNLDSSIIKSAGRVIPPEFLDLIDSVDADDGVIDGSGLNGHSWFSSDGTSGVKFTFPPGTTAAGLVWTDGADGITFSAFGPGGVPLGKKGPFNGIADGSSSGTTAEDRFFGVRDAAGIESILISGVGGGIELDHVQYGFAAVDSVQDFALDWFTLDSGGGTSVGDVFEVSGTITQPEADVMSGGIFAVTGEFLSLMAAATPTDVSPELAVDGLTAIPGGTGNFTSLPFAPSLSGDNLAFYGTGSGGQQGIYLTTRGIPGEPIRIADLKTPIPNGAGNFLSFGTEAGIIIVSGNTGVFAGAGSGGQRGIYAAVMVPPQVGSPLRIADLATAIPGGSGNFMEFPNTPSLSGNTAVFAGNGTGGQRGVYAAVMVPPQVGSPLRIADTAMAIPGGTGNFTEFPNGQSISGNKLVFAGNGASGQRGVYAAVMVPPQVGSPLRIADTATAIPGGTGNFMSFGSEAGIIIVSGNNAVFTGDGAGAQQGIYGARLLAPTLQASALHGTGEQQGINSASVISVGPPFKIADTATPIPGGSGNFTGFGAVSVNEDEVTFLGMGADGQTGIYALTGGQLRKVIAVGEPFEGKTITGLNFSRDGLSEGEVAFQATFSDGSQGVYTLEVPSAAEGLRLTVVSTSGNELRISFTGSSGQGYVIESRADLVAGAWAEVPGTTTTSSGAAQQLILPIALAQPQQFYRVKIVP